MKMGYTEWKSQFTLWEISFNLNFPQKNRSSNKKWVWSGQRSSLLLSGNPRVAVLGIPQEQGHICVPCSLSMLSPKVHWSCDTQMERKTHNRSAIATIGYYKSQKLITWLKRRMTWNHESKQNLTILDQYILEKFCPCALNMRIRLLGWDYPSKLRIKA